MINGYVKHQRIKNCYVNEIYRLKNYLWANKVNKLNVWRSAIIGIVDILGHIFGVLDNVQGDNWPRAGLHLI